MPAFLSSYFIQLYTGVVARQSFREFISGSQLQSLTQFNRKSNMQEDKCAERLVGIKAKIASISAMDPSLRGSIEEIEELKKKKPISLMPIIARRSENRTSQLQAEPIRPLSSEKKIFISDAVYYMNLHQKYERSALANINAPRNEVVPNEKMKESELSNEGEKEEGKEEVRRVSSNANQPASLFKLQPVIQESTIPEPQKETQTTKPVQQSQTAEIRETEQPQARSPVREVKDNKQKEGSLFNEPNSQKQIKPFFKPLAEAPKLNFFSNPPQNSLFGKAPDTASQLLFPVDKDKKMEIKPLGLFSQKPQPVNLSQVKADTIQQPQNVPKPTSTFLKVPQIGLNFPPQNESSKPPIFSFPPSNPQKIIFPSLQQAPATKLPLFSAGTPKLFDKEQEKQPQTTQPQQKKTRHLQGLFKNSQQVTPTNVPLNINETQKPMTNLFGNSQQASQPLLFGGSLLPPPPTNSSQSLSTAPKPTLGLFSSNSSNEKPATESKPPTFTPSFAPAKIEPVASPEIKTEGLFQKKTIFNELPATPVSQGGLFSNNNANNPPKEQPKPVVSQNNQSSLFQNKEPVAPIQQQPEKAEKEEKKEKSNMFTVIGPGGKKLEMTSFSMGESKKTNMFNSINNPTEVKNVFSQPSNLFQTSNSIFQQANTVVPNAFSQPQPAAQTENIFAKPINLFASTLFNPNQPKNGFGPAECQLFGKTGEIEEDQGDEGEDDGPLMDEDTANPNLSTGKFDYVKTQVHFKESAVKFREGTVKDNVIENITVSIQSFENSQDRYLHIRLANKCIAFTGMFLKDRTVSRSINNSDKNVEVSFILKIKDGVPAGGVLLRIQFKEESIGAKFLKEANAINATA